MLRFENSMCMTSTGDNGTCYTKGDCEAKGGNAQVKEIRKSV